MSFKEQLISCLKFFQKTNNFDLTINQILEVVKIELINILPKGQDIFLADDLWKQYNAGWNACRSEIIRRISKWTA